MGVLQEIGVNGCSGAAVSGTLKELYLTFKKKNRLFTSILLRPCQEPITRSLQLPHIPVTAFSQTELFLV